MSFLEDVSPDKALVWLDFKNQISIGTANYIKNYGNTKLSPKTVICGVSGTSTTYPTQITGQKGIGFDGGDHINTNITNVLTITQPFTIATCISNIGTGGTLSLFGNYNANTDTGIVIYINQSSELVFFTLLQNPGNLSRQCRISFPKSIYKNRNTIIATYSGNGVANATGLNLYLNGTQIANVYTTNSTVPNLANGSPYFIGSVTNNSGTSSYQYTGNMYHSSVFMKCFSQPQVKQLHNIIMRSIKV